MATITTNHAHAAINMTSLGLVGPEAPMSVRDADLWTWSTAPLGSSGDRVILFGEGLTYGAGGLTGGTVQSLAFDRFDDAEGAGEGDLLVTGLGPDLDVTRLRPGDARMFWDEVLKGNDSFDLSGLDQDVQGTSVIFGDDLASARGTVVQSVTDSGGDDTMTGGAAAMRMIGDVVTVEGFKSEAGTLGDKVARYQAGDDRMTGAATDRAVEMVGDADRVGPLGALKGGDDILDNSANTSSNSWTFGDLKTQDGGTVHGGDDTLTLAKADGAFGAGDAYRLDGGTLYGGDDILRAVAGSVIAGDVTGSVAQAQGTVVGGGDTLEGSAVADTLVGDVIDLRSGVTLTGGADTIHGGGGNDLIQGEIATGSFDHVSGGSDRLYGEEGRDHLYGQRGDDRLYGGSDKDRLFGGSGQDQLRGGTGDDRLEGRSGGDTLRGDEGSDWLYGGDGEDLLRGGTGDDVLAGGNGADLFVFGVGSGRDRIAGFVDAGGAADDRIDLRDLDLDGRGDLTFSAGGDGHDALVGLGGGSRIRLEGYLDGHALSDLGASDFLF